MMAKNLLSDSIPVRYTVEETTPKTKQTDEELLLGAKESVMVKKHKKIKSETQKQIDRYIELYKYSKEIEHRMKDMKANILEYMVGRDFDEVEGSDGGRIVTGTQNRATQNSRYTTYDVDLIKQYIPEAYKEMCMTTVIDKDTLELLVKAGKVDKDVLELKDLHQIDTFRVIPY